MGNLLASGDYNELTVSRALSMMVNLSAQRTELLERLAVINALMGVAIPVIKKLTPQEPPG
jgi:hypothetical protein